MLPRLSSRSFQPITHHYSRQILKCIQWTDKTKNKTKHILIYTHYTYEHFHTKHNINIDWKSIDHTQGKPVRVYRLPFNSCLKYLKCVNALAQPNEQNLKIFQDPFSHTEKLCDLVI